MAYTGPNFVREGYPVSVGASESNYRVSEVVQLGTDDRCNLAILVKTTACSGTVEVDLQHSPDGVNHWATVNTTEARLSFTSATTQRLFINTLNTNSKSYLPLFPFVRVVATTAGGESITISDIHIAVNQQ
jgi:hypothetical protein